MQQYPFSCSITPGFPELLHQLNATLVISTYQAGKVIFISLNQKGQLIQLPRTFEKSMGVAVEGHQMAVAAKDKIHILAHSQLLGKTYPKSPGVYDTLYMPRATYYTGLLDIHDLHWGKEGLWAVNTSFSCLCIIDAHYNFTPRWQPHFITELEHDDFCHLNGMAMEEGAPRYVTLLGQTTTRKGWRDNILDGGLLMDVPSNTIMSLNMGMPHSPRLYDGKLFALLSSKGELICIDRDNGSYEVVASLGRFIRGLSRLGDYLFIGCSRLRQSSTTFEKLKPTPVGQNSNTAGIIVFHLPTGQVVGELNYQNSVEEIYDIQILPGLRRPGILNMDGDEHLTGLMIPNQGYWSNELPENMR